MSKALQIIQAKPNPLGKDKTGSGQSKPEQLLGEWVDAKNIGTESIQFSSMTLNHTLFDSRCQSTNRTEKYWSGGPEQLLPGQVIRVHTGNISDKHLTAEADRVGVRLARVCQPRQLRPEQPLRRPYLHHVAGRQRQDG